MNDFKDFNLSKQLFAAIKKLEYSKPTEIQERSIPHIMEGKDVIGESATGSGKTLAFGCGIVDRVIKGGGVQAMVLAPTRELAEQVRMSLSKLSREKGLKVMSIYGGVSMDPQIRNLSRSEVVVATPGRLLDHLQRGNINTSKISMLVLDEVDRMLDMGFIEDVEKIIQACPKKKQMLCFSATVAPRIKQLANKYMNNPVKVSAKNQVDPSKLKQVYYDVHKGMKLSLLVHLLQHENSSLIMVFCNTRKTTDFVVKNLRANKVEAIAIHGGLSQNRRTKTIESFNDAKKDVLVCTDVAARGLHIDNVSHIYNYEIPKDPKDYVHRIGRTARAEEEGKVINLLCDYDHDNFARILRDYREFSIKNIKKPYVEKINAIRTMDRRGADRRRPPRRRFHRRR